MYRKETFISNAVHSMTRKMLHREWYEVYCRQSETHMITGVLDYWRYVRNPLGGNKENCRQFSFILVYY